MWERLQHALQRLWRRSQKGRNERRTVEARGRFWAEVRDGQREAEAQRGPASTDSRGPSEN
jgi:hypothetical protein